MNGVAEALTGWPQAEAAGPAPAGRLPHRQRANPPAGREPRPPRPAGGDDRRAGQPHRPHRPGRDGTAHRRQRRAHAGRGRGRGRGGPGLPRRHRAPGRPRKLLRRKEAELRDFVENATVGLHWVGPDGIILWANQAELELLGYTREEYIGRHIAEFHVDRPVIDDILAPAPEQGGDPRLRGAAALQGRLGQARR